MFRWHNAKGSNDSRRRRLDLERVARPGEDFPLPLRDLRGGRLSVRGQTNAHPLFGRVDPRPLGDAPPDDLADRFDQRILPRLGRHDDWPAQPFRQPFELRSPQPSHRWCQEGHHDRRAALPHLVDGCPGDLQRFANHREREFDLEWSHARGRWCDGAVVRLGDQLGVTSRLGPPNPSMTSSHTVCARSRTRGSGEWPEDGGQPRPARRPARASGEFPPPARLSLQLNDRLLVRDPRDVGKGKAQRHPTFVRVQACLDQRRLGPENLVQALARALTAGKSGRSLRDQRLVVDDLALPRARSRRRSLRRSARPTWSRTSTASGLPIAPPIGVCPLPIGWTLSDTADRKPRRPTNYPTPLPKLSTH